MSTWLGTPIPFSGSGFSISLPTFLLFDISTLPFVTNPWGLGSSSWMCSGYMFCCCRKAWSSPSPESTSHILSTMSVPHLLRGPVVTLQISVEVSPISQDEVLVFQVLVLSCLVQQFGSPYVFIFISLFWPTMCLLHGCPQKTRSVPLTTLPCAVAQKGLVPVGSKHSPFIRE